MTRIGTVIGIENLKDGPCVVIRGIGRIEDSQRLHFKKDVWTVVKKRWVKGEDASFLLKSLTNKVPEIGQKLELIIDDVKFITESNHPLEVIDCFMLPHKDEMIFAITLFGITEIKPGDILASPAGESWKVLETSMTVTPGVNRRFMVSIETKQGSQSFPMQGMKLTKINIDEETPVQEEPIQLEPKVSKPKSSTKKPKVVNQ